MIYREEIRNLFDVPDDYYLAHCISADFAMGKGIATEFVKRFDMKNKLKSKYPQYEKMWDSQDKYEGDCIMNGRVLNLVTKKNYWEKPTYNSIEKALIICGIECLAHDIKKVAMPVIGCGLDRLKWDKVSEIIKEVFRNTDIEILVCKVKEK